MFVILFFIYFLDVFYRSLDFSPLCERKQLDTIHALISIKHGFTLLDVEGGNASTGLFTGCEREGERTRERATEGGRELFHWQLL